MDLIFQEINNKNNSPKQKHKNNKTIIIYLLILCYVMYIIKKNYKQ